MLKSMSRRGPLCVHPSRALLPMRARHVNGLLRSSCDGKTECKGIEWIMSLSMLITSAVFFFLLPLFCSRCNTDSGLDYAESEFVGRARLFTSIVAFFFLPLLFDLTSGGTVSQEPLLSLPVNVLDNMLQRAQPVL